MVFKTALKILSLISRHLFWDGGEKLPSAASELTNLLTFGSARLVGFELKQWEAL